MLEATLCCTFLKQEANSGYRFSKMFEQSKIDIITRKDISNFKDKMIEFVCERSQKIERLKIYFYKGAT